jgi:hypothetical protein
MSAIAKSIPISVEASDRRWFVAGRPCGEDGASWLVRENSRDRGLWSRTAFDERRADQNYFRLPVNEGGLNTATHRPNF